MSNVLANSDLVNQIETGIIITSIIQIEMVFKQNVYSIFIDLRALCQ